MITYGLVKQVGPYARDYPSRYIPSNKIVMAPRYPYSPMEGFEEKSPFAARQVPDREQLQKPKKQKLQNEIAQKQYQALVNVFLPSMMFNQPFGVQNAAAPSVPPSEPPAPLQTGETMPELMETSESYETAESPSSPVAGLQEVLARTTSQANELLRQRQQLAALLEQPFEPLPINAGVWDPTTPLQFLSLDTLKQMDEDMARISIPDSETLQKSLDEISNVYSQLSDESSLVRELAKLRLETSQQELLNLTKQQKDVEEAIRSASTQPSQKSSLLDQAVSTISYSPSFTTPSVSGSNSGSSFTSSTKEFIGFPKNRANLASLASAPNPPLTSPTLLQRWETRIAAGFPPSTEGLEQLLKKQKKLPGLMPVTQEMALRKKPGVGTIKKRQSLRIQTKPKVNYTGMQNSDASSGSNYSAMSL
jgi:hypothetical protein